MEIGALRCTAVALVVMTPATGFSALLGLAMVVMTPGLAAAGVLALVVLLLLCAIRPAGLLALAAELVAASFAEVLVAVAPRRPLRLRTEPAGNIV